MNKKNVLSIFCILLGFTFFAPVTFASPEVLSESWVFSPKAGKLEDMEQAMKKHGEHRDELKDPREWRLYSRVLGDNLDSVSARSFGFSWADMDSYRAWNIEKNPQKHFNEYVDKHIANTHHYLSVLDLENSNWGPEVEYKYVGVTSYNVKMGHRSAVDEDKKIMSDAAKANDWPFNWQWSDSVSGEDSMILAVPFKNWASMAPAETKFAEVLAKHLGDGDKAKELFVRWSSHFESIRYDIYVLREDLMN